MFVVDNVTLEALGLPQRAGVHPIVVENVTPVLDGGRFAVKAIVGDRIVVEADAFREGHDAIAVALRYRAAGDEVWNEREMIALGNDRWRSIFTVERNVRYEFAIEAWPDAAATWHRDLEAKRAADQAVTQEVWEGRALVAAASERASGADRELLGSALAAFDRVTGDDVRAALLLASPLEAALARTADRTAATTTPVFEIDVDRPAAAFGAWYEFFPRSQSTAPHVHGTLADAARRLPAIARMGFDVVYLPPIHPIGYAFRKGRNNALEPGPSDPGSPWAIGNTHGGHMAIEPALGDFATFAAFVTAAHSYGLEVALDYALQCSPDHPWITEHPEWFAFRPDGSLKYAENPPKKYQDIVNFNWYGSGAPALWSALRDIVLFWVERGVTLFRVDNPHTKPFAFWEWMIRTVREQHPEVLFLAEAFTRPSVMQHLAKRGFSQSYTYFTWRTTKEELTDYATELAGLPLASFFRPHFWPTTPDILTPYLQTGGRPAFRVRLILAATLASVYGIYSGYEICENVGLPESEEYADSEKYEIRGRNYDAPGNIVQDIARVNTIRRQNPALQDWRNSTFYRADDPEVIFYGKRTAANLIFVAVNLDPFTARDALLWFPTGELGIAEDREYHIEELLGRTQHRWRGSAHRWRLDPHINPSAIFRLTLPKADT